MKFQYHRVLLPLVLICYFTVAWFSDGFYHDDEHYQIMEFANFKDGGITGDDLPWEYDYKMRPSLQPIIAWNIIRLARYSGIDNPFDQALILRLLSALLSFGAIWLFLRNRKGMGFTEFPPSAILYSYLLWTSVFVNVRFSSENWSSTFFFAGLALFFGESRPASRYFLSGLLMGLSCVMRYQSAIFIAAFLLWLLIVERKKILLISGIVIGCLASLIIGGLADTWFYGELVFPPWNYFKWNILEGKADHFGIEPIWYYFYEIFLKAIPPFGLLLIFCFLYFWYKFPKSVITWISLSFVLVHTFIGHKELRFLFPLTFIVPVILSVSVNTFLQEQKYLNRYLENEILVRRTRKILFTLNLLVLLILCIDIPKKQIRLFRYLYEEHAELSNLYYKEVNPYVEENPMSFYRQKKLEVHKLNMLDSLAIGQGSFLLCTELDISGDLSRSGLHHKLLFQSIPSWLTYFNFGNWQSRSRIWRVYRVEN